MRKHSPFSWPRNLSIAPGRRAPRFYRRRPTWRVIGRELGSAPLPAPSLAAVAG
jgi:hypothetical protein